MTASSAGRRLFTYATTRTVRHLLWMAVTLGICIGILAAATYSPAWAFAFCFVGLFAGRLIFDFFRERPVAIDGERIEALLFGRAWRTIEWRDVDRIENRLIPEDFNGEAFVPAHREILFMSGWRTITVLSDILEFDALERLAAETARQRGIAYVPREM
jgi:hypothetical protein